MEGYISSGPVGLERAAAVASVDARHWHMHPMFS